MSNEITMQPLELHDLIWALRRLPRKVSAALQKYPKVAFVAGGFIRSTVANEEVNDVDLFAPTPELAKEVANSLAPDQDRAKNADGLLPGVRKTDNAYTIASLKPVAQVIHRWNYTNPEECLKSFDFTVAQAAIWHDGEKFVSLCSSRFYADLAAKRLVYLSPVRNEDAGGSFLRVLKFYQRGYRIPLDSAAAVVSRLLRGVKDDNTLFWTGVNKDGRPVGDGEVDAYRAKILCGLLREVDPNIDPNHVAHLPSMSEETEQKPSEGLPQYQG